MTTPTSIETLRERLGDRYVIERELGRGGMGTVYLARDVRLDRPVALKVLPPEFASDVALRERFLRETRTAASFSHPNIVPVHEVLERDGVLAFAMGLVEGESLADRVRRAGPLDVRSIVRMLQDIGYALAYAHGRGVVHRDIKPDNIMVDRATGRALLMDFGISRSITATVARPGLTRVGEVVGTPEYMSPEQASGDSVDGRSDIYSLGLVALFALTGRAVIAGDSTQKILVKQLTELPPPAQSLRPDLPPALAEAIDRCVAKAADDRFATAESLVELIDGARLSAPEIPLPVRMFAQEAGTVGLLLWFLAILTPLLVQSMSTGGSLDGLIPLVLILAIATTRISMTSGAARRLAMLGFAPAEIMKGMRAVVDEREGLRAQLAADPEARARRRNTARIAGLLVVAAVVVVYFSLKNRVKVSPGHWHTGPGALAAGMLGLIMFGVGFLLLIRNPARMPPNERLFRMVWLGPFGRLFLRFSARGVALAGSGRSSASSARVAVAPQPVPAAAVAAVAAVPADRLTAIEARLTALERADRRT